MAPKNPPVSLQPLAVIDIGSHAVRMDIAQPDAKGGFRKLEGAHQAVTLGKDTFSRGTIENATIAECISALNSFRKTLKDYGIESAEQIRVVATSAVREAENRDTFLDRVETATGFTVQVLEEAEVNRYNFLSMHPVLQRGLLKARSDLFLIEVGSGSTELLVLRRGRVAFSYTYRLGSLRLREMLEGFKDSPAHVSEFITSQIARTVEQIRRIVGTGNAPHMIAAGGDIRFAVARLKQKPQTPELESVPVKALARFAGKIAALPVDALVREYQITFGDAETLGPALLFYARLAEALSLKNLFVTSHSMRDGVFMEMTSPGDWTAGFRQQIIHSALEVGRKYRFDSRHAAQVTALSEKLFDALSERHRLKPRYRLLLTIAALLHDTGLFISNHNHHKHSMYLIQNSDLFGLGSHDILMAALVARYHRRALPNPDHDPYGTLTRPDRLAVSKMAALLRVADALDRRQAQKLSHLEFAVQEDAFAIKAHHVTDITVEQLALKKKGDLFEKLFGLKPLLVRANG